MRIQHNIMAMNAYRNYNLNNKALSGNLEKLSSGYKINRAGDDAAGLAISEKMRAQITGLNAAQKNVKDGISLVKTAEGAMQEIQDMLNRMDYLATQSANGTYDNEVDRVNLQKEVDALKTEINRIADSANFNGIKLLDGSKAEVASAKETLAISAAGTPVGGSSATVVLGSATGTATAGVSASGGTVTFPSANFVTATGHFGLHEGTTSNQQANPSFTIDLKDLAVSGNAAAGSAVTVTIEFAGVTLTVTGDGISSMSAASIAASFAAAPHNATTAGLVSIGGLTFSVTNDGTKLKFTLSTAQNATFTASQAASVNEKIQGSDVKVAVTGAGTNTGLTGNYIHGLEDVNLAQAKTDGKLSGISLTLDNSIVKDGSVLTIGNTKYVFKTEAVSSKASTANGEILIDVSNTASADQGKEAARLMSLVSQNTITHAGTVNGTAGTTNFEISMVSGSNVIHLDQKAVTSGTDRTYKEADLKGMFGLSTPLTSETKGSITVSAGTPTIEANVGDRFKVGDKTYTIVADAAEAVTSGNDLKMTADDFKTEMVSQALNQAKDAVAASYGKFDFTVSAGAGTITAALKSTGATAGVDDTQATVSAINSALVSALNGFKVAKSGSLTVSVGDVSGDADVAAGDKFTMGSKTYTIVENAEDATKKENYENTANIKITADGFKSIMKDEAVKAVVEDVKKTYGDFNFTISGSEINVKLADGKGTIGTTDDSAKMTAIKDALVNGLAAYKLEKVDGEESGAAGLKLQIGDTSDSFNQMSVKIGDMHTKAMGTGKTTLDGVEQDVTDTIADIDISSQEGAQNAVAVIKNAINYVSGIRGDLGAIQNRLDHTANNLSVMAENIQDAESTIRDTDVAEEMMSYVKNNILVQSAQAMLAQANQVPQGVLQLLG